MNRITISLSIIILCSFSCQFKQKYDFGKEVAEKSRTQFNKKKDLMFSTALEGTVSNIEYCEDCNLNRYVITINIEEIDPLMDFKNSFYSPFYTYIDSLMNLSLSEKTFNNVSVGDKFKKNKNSRFFSLNNSTDSLELISDLKYKWIP